METLNYHKKYVAKYNEYVDDLGESNMCIDMKDEQTKPKFNIDDYKGEYCMHCDTRKKLQAFIRYMKLYTPNEKDVDYTYWKDFWEILREDTAYCFNDDVYRTVDCARKTGYTVLEFDNFKWIVKPKFNIDNYQGSYCMHCDTLAKSKIFCNYLKSIGKNWECTSGISKPYNKTSWSIHGEDTVYCFNEGKCENIHRGKISKYTILEFDDFNWHGISSTLKSEEYMQELTNSKFKLHQTIWYKFGKTIISAEIISIKYTMILSDDGISDYEYIYTVRNGNGSLRDIHMDDIRKLH